MHWLYLEDDPAQAHAVVADLESQGHAVTWVKNSQHAERALQDSEFQGLVLETDLCDSEGLDLLKSWRSRGDDRLMVITSRRDALADRLEGLRAGADDYLCKPFDPQELAARLEAVGRRCGIRPVRVMKSAQVTLDFDRKTAVVNNDLVPLTAMEWTLLSCLAHRPGHTLSRDQIRAALSQPGRDEPDSNSMEVIISRVRRKLGSNLIRTHRGMGYRLTP